MENYFNYFTEIEERFRQGRQSGMFLLSPLDWALIETWKDSGVPLEAALAGIDRAFEKWRRRKRKFQNVNSLAYCAQEVLTAAREMAEGGAPEERGKRQAAFQPDELAAYFRRNAEALRQTAGRTSGPLAALATETAESLGKLAGAAEAGSLGDLEEVEQRLTALEDRLQGALLQGSGEDELFEIRQRMQRELAPYRRNMTAEQIALLERQYLQRAALERAGLPRLSLFYLH